MPDYRVLPLVGVLGGVIFVAIALGLVGLGVYLIIGSVFAPHGSDTLGIQRFFLAIGPIILLFGVFR